MASNYDRIVRLIVTGDTAGAIKAMQDLEKKSDSFGTKAEALGSKVTKLGKTLNMISLPLLAVGAYAVKSAVSFQSSMKLIETQTRASSAEVARQSKNILGLAGQVGAGPEELAQGLYPIESIGLRGKAAYGALKAAAIGAAVGHDTLANTSNAVAAAMATQLKDVHNASQAMGMMDAIVGHGKMVLEELTEAMKSGILPQAKQVGLGMQDVGDALDVLTSKGVPATTAATRLRLNLTQMVAPSAEAVKALKQVGLGQQTLGEDLRKPQGLIVVLRTLREHLQGLSSVTQSRLLAEMFGKSKGSSNMMALLQGLPQMEQLMPKLQSHLGENFAHTKESASFKLHAALAAGKAALVELGNVLMPVVIPALTKLAGVVIGAVRALTHLPKPVKTVILVLASVVAVAGPMLVVIGKVISAVGVLANAFKAVNAAISIGSMFDPVTLGLIAISVLVLLVATHFKTFQHIVGAVFGWLRGAVGTVIGFVKAHWPLLLGIMLGPFGFLVGYVATHFTQIRKIVETVFGAVGAFVGKIFDGIVNNVVKAINLVIGAINLIIKGYNSVPSFLRPTGTVKEIGLVKEIGDGGRDSSPRRGAPAFAGHGALETHRLRVDNKIYIDRRSIGRPVAEAVTEYTARRKARQG